MSQIDELSKKTPGVYINEIPSFPPTVVQVETAVPAFIGYTKNHSSELNMKPVKIFSFLEIRGYFRRSAAGRHRSYCYCDCAFPGECHDPAPAPEYTLYYHIRMFFDNGGGKCYIVSVGSYSDAIEAGAAAPASGLIGGLKAVEAEDEPTILVVPEAILLTTTSQN